MTLWTAISLAVDDLLLAQINDEVAACLDNRGPTNPIIDAVVAAAQAKNEGVPELAISDLSSLFKDRTEFNIGSTFLDFIVGMV